MPRLLVASGMSCWDRAESKLYESLCIVAVGREISYMLKRNKSTKRERDW